MGSVAARRSHRIAVIWLAVLVSACSGSSPSTKRPTVTVSSGTLAATPSVVTTTASPSVGAGATPMPASESPLEPGTYTDPSFRPSVTFAVGEGWIAGHELPDFFDVQHPDAVVVFAAPSYLYERQGVRRDVDGMAPKKAGSTIADNPDLGAGPVRVSAVGGVPGATVELVPTAAAGLFGGEFPYTTAVGTAYRLTFLSVDGALVVVMAVSRQQPFGPGFAEAERVVRSVSFA